MSKIKFLRKLAEQGRPTEIKAVLSTISSYVDDHSPSELAESYISANRLLDEVSGTSIEGLDFMLKTDSWIEIIGKINGVYEYIGYFTAGIEVHILENINNGRRDLSINFPGDPYELYYQFNGTFYEPIYDTGSDLQRFKFK